MVQLACQIGTGGGDTDGIATLDELRHSLIELDEVKTLRLTKQLLAQEGPTRPSILSTCQNALRVVGERYERQEYYLSALIMAGEIFTRVLTALPSFRPERRPDGTTFRSWLMTIARNTVIDSARRQRPSVPIDDARPAALHAALPAAGRESRQGRRCCFFVNRRVHSRRRAASAWRWHG